MDSIGDNRQLTRRPGKALLQLPGPTNIPDRVLNAMRVPALDQKGGEFAALSKEVQRRVRGLFKTAGPVVIWPSSGTGAWEAAIVNTLSPGDRVLMHDTGQFAMLWHRMAQRFGLDTVYLTEGDWRRAFDPNLVEEHLRADTAHAIKAVLVVHNETSNGTLCRMADIRAAMDAAGHPALLLTDTISSLGCADYRHDDWRADVTVCGSQKGMMLPAGLGFNAVSDKALEAKKTARFASCYWDWDWMTEQMDDGFYPYTPSVQMFFGLREALDMIDEEGLETVFARHLRHAAATRAAVWAWGLELAAVDAREYSPSVTAVMVPEGHSADTLRAVTRDGFNVGLGGGLGRFVDRVFRIGHMGDLSDAQLIGTLGAVEMALGRAGVPHAPGGVQAATDVLREAVA